MEAEDTILIRLEQLVNDGLLSCAGLTLSMPTKGKGWASRDTEANGSNWLTGDGSRMVATGRVRNGSLSLTLSRAGWP